MAEDEVDAEAQDALRRAERALEEQDWAAFTEALGEAGDLDDLQQSLHTILRGFAEGRDVMVVVADEHYSPAQAAAKLGVSRKLLNKMLDAGQLTHFTKPQSRHKVIPGSEIVRLLHERQLFATLARVQAAGSKAASARGVRRDSLEGAIRNAPAPSEEDHARVEQLIAEAEHEARPDESTRDAASFLEATADAADRPPQSQS